MNRLNDEEFEAWAIRVENKLDNLTENVINLVTRLNDIRAAWRAMPAGVRESLMQYHPETLAEWEGLLK